MAQIKMQHSKETARKSVFRAEGQAIDTVYVERTAFKGGKPPKTITINCPELADA